MKKIAFVFALAFVAFAFTKKEKTTIVKDKINWMTLEEAVEAQKKNPKKILMDAYTVWCGPCKMLEKNTFSNEDVITYVNTNFYAVKFNAEGNESITYKDNVFTNPNYDEKKKNTRNSSHQLASYFRIGAYPTIVYIDENNQLIAPVPGYQDIKGIEFYLKLFGTDAFRSIQSKEAFEKYKNEFVYEFHQ